jgi:hypothetical protein
MALTNNAETALLEAALEREAKYRGIEQYTPEELEERIWGLLSSPLTANKEVLRSMIARDSAAVTRIASDLPILLTPEGKGHPQFPHFRERKVRLKCYKAALRHLSRQGLGQKLKPERQANSMPAAVSLETTTESSAIIDDVEQRRRRNQELIKDYMKRRRTKNLYEIYTASNAPAGKAEIYGFWNGTLPDYRKNGKPSTTALRIRQFFEAGRPLVK